MCSTDSMSASHLHPPNKLSTGHTSECGTGHGTAAVPCVAWLARHCCEQYHAWLHWPVADTGDERQAMISCTAFTSRRGGLAAEQRGAVCERTFDVQAGWVSSETAATDALLPAGYDGGQVGI